MKNNKLNNNKYTFENIHYLFGSFKSIYGTLLTSFIGKPQKNSVIKERINLMRSLVSGKSFNEIEVKHPNMIDNTKIDLFDEKNFNRSEKTLFNFFCQKFLHKKDTLTSEEEYISFYQSFDKENIRPQAYLYMLQCIFSFYQEYKYDKLINLILNEFSNQDTYFNQNIQQLMPSLLSISAYLDFNPHSTPLAITILDKFPIEKLVDIKTDENKENNINYVLYRLLIDVVVRRSSKSKDVPSQSLEALLNNKAFQSFLHDESLVLDLSKAIVRQKDGMSLHALLQHNTFDIFDEVRHYYTEQLGKKQSHPLDSKPEQIYQTIDKFKLKYRLDNSLKENKSNDIKRNKI